MIFTIIGLILIINILVVIILIFNRYFIAILGFALFAFYIFILTLGAR